MVDKSKVVKVQSNIPMAKCESFIVEDTKNLWIFELGKCHLVEPVVDRIREEKGGGSWERINENLKHSKKK